MKLVTSINGRIVKRGQDRISVFDNSLLYAEGLFETCLAVDGRLIFLKQHMDRLFRGARVIGMKIPVDHNTISRWMTKTTQAHPNRIVKVRLTVTAGESSRWVGKQGKAQVIISVSPHTIPTELFDLQVSPFRVDQDSVFRRIKTLSYIIHAIALGQAKSSGRDDALLLNEKNQVSEVTSANIFWVKRKRIFTPPLNSGCLDGITRRIVMIEAGKLGIEVAEKVITMNSLAKADEIFISSSLKLVIGVARIRTDKETLKFNSGEFTDLLRRRFLALAGLT